MCVCVSDVCVWIICEKSLQVVTLIFLSFTLRPSFRILHMIANIYKSHLFLFCFDLLWGVLFSFALVFRELPFMYTSLGMGVCVCECMCGWNSQRLLFVIYLIVLNLHNPHFMVKSYEFYSMGFLLHFCGMTINCRTTSCCLWYLSKGTDGRTDIHFYFIAFGYKCS